MFELQNSVSKVHVQLYSVADLADMIAIGLDLPPGTFREAGRYAFVFLILSIAYLCVPDIVFIQTSSISSHFV